MLAPDFPRRAAEVVRDGLRRCSEVGLPAPAARLHVEAVRPGALGTAYGRCHEAIAATDGTPTIRIELVASVLACRERSRLRIPLGLHAVWHEYAHALDQRLETVPAADGVWGRFGRHTAAGEWRRLFVAHRTRRLPYLSPLARRGVEEFFAEAVVALLGRPALLRGAGEPLAAALARLLAADRLPTRATVPDAPALQDATVVRAPPPA